MPIEYYNAFEDIELIADFGDSGRYVDWIAFQRFEARINDNISAGAYGKYSEIVSKLYYQVKNDLREALKKVGILYT